MGKTGTILRVVYSFLKWLPREELKWNHPLNFYIYTHNYYTHNYALISTTLNIDSLSEHRTVQVTSWEPVLDIERTF